MGGSYRGDQALVNVMMMSFSTFADQILEKRESEIFFCRSSRCWLLGERWREWLLSSLQLTAATELSSLIVWWRFKTITSCVVENSTNSGKEKTDNWIKRRDISSKDLWTVLTSLCCKKDQGYIAESYQLENFLSQMLWLEFFFFLNVVE